MQVWQFVCVVTALVPVCSLSCACLCAVARPAVGYDEANLQVCPVLSLHQLTRKHCFQTEEDVTRFTRARNQVIAFEAVYVLLGTRIQQLVARVGCF